MTTPNALNQIIIRMQMLMASGLTFDDFAIHRDEVAQLLAAIKLADDCAVVEIESNCERERIGDALWYDIAPELDADKRAGEEIACMREALDHLAARQMIELHPTRSGFVRLITAPTEEIAQPTATMEA